MPSPTTSTDAPPGEGAGRRGALRFRLRLLAVALAAGVGIPLQWALLKLRSPLRARLPVLFHRVVTRALGVRVRVVGAPATGRPLLLVANHVSWLDITVLSRVMPLSFVSKSEVNDWPVFGLFARLQRTVFVERARRGATGEVVGAIARRLLAGDPLVLFAEGTTGDGARVLPFRSALLGAATVARAGSGASEGPPVLVQPVGIAYVGRDGLPIGRAGLPGVAWYGDMEMAPHFRAALSAGTLDAVVAFGEPVPFAPGADRKALAARLEAEVRRMVESARRGR